MSNEIIKEMKNAVIHIRIPYKWKEICKTNANQKGFKTMSTYCVHLIKLDQYYSHSAWPRGKGGLEGGSVLSEEEFTRKLAYDRAFEMAFRKCERQ